MVRKGGAQYRSIPWYLTIQPNFGFIGQFVFHGHREFCNGLINDLLASTSGIDYDLFKGRSGKTKEQLISEVIEFRQQNARLNTMEERLAPMGPRIAELGEKKDRLNELLDCIFDEIWFYDVNRNLVVAKSLR